MYGKNLYYLFKISLKFVYHLNWVIYYSGNPGLLMVAKDILL